MEDLIDEPYINNTVIIRKNLILVLMLIIVFLMFVLMSYQKTADQIECNNTLIIERAKYYHLPVWDPSSGSLIYINSSR